MRRALLACAVCLAVLIAWFCWPRHANLRGFDPQAMARVETAAWRHYYEKQWPALFRDLYRGGRAQYGFSPCDACQLALHAARAARRFQPSRNRAEAEQAIAPLIDYFRVIRRGANAEFDPDVAAAQELEWWQLRREDQPWQEYGRAIAAASATVYGRAPAQLEPGSLKRAALMDLRDRKGRSMTDADWQEIERGLVEAWTLIKQAVATGGD